MDFGLSKIVERMSQMKTSRVGTNVYMAPEVILDSKYTEKCDVFSFSILCYIVVTEELNPYGTHEEFGIELKVAADPNFRPNLESLRSGDDVEGISKFLWIEGIIKMCWKHSEKDRPSFREVIRVWEGYSRDDKEYTVEEADGDDNKGSENVIVKHLKTDNCSMEEKYEKVKFELEDMKKKYEELCKEDLKKEKKLKEITSECENMKKKYEELKLVKKERTIV